MPFIVVPPIRAVETIAKGAAIRERKQLNRAYGNATWRKLKGVAIVEFPDGGRSLAEVHWYEAHGIGKREFKIKRLLEN